MLPEKYISYYFIKFIRPIWYFHLKPYNEVNNVWIEYEQLSIQEKELVQYDQKYSNQALSNWDASYQALMKGIVKQVRNNSQTKEIKLLPIDIYRFVRKYHKKIWLYSTFIQRLFSFSNPINELIGFWQTRQVKNINLFHSHYEYDEYRDYDSLLIKSNPLVSIIIPTLNRYESLNKVLEDLQKQVYVHFEVIVIDQSNPFHKEFYNQFNFKYHIIRQEEPALWKARNSGIKSAESEYLLFLDDDSEIAQDWIAEHIKCMDYFNADISSGVSISMIGAKVPENYSFFRWSDQLDTGNVLIKKKVFEKCGLFDEQFERMRMGDGEFGIRTYLNGLKNVSNHKASRIHLKETKGGLRDIGHWDGFRSKNIFSPRPIPSILYLYRKYWGNQSALVSLILSIPLSFSPYKLKSQKAGYILSIIIFFIFLPLVIILVFFSWSISSRMLKTGGLIRRL